MATKTQTQKSAEQSAQNRATELFNTIRQEVTEIIQLQKKILDDTTVQDQVADFTGNMLVSEIGRSMDYWLKRFEQTANELLIEQNTSNETQKI